MIRPPYATSKSGARDQTEITEDRAIPVELENEVRPHQTAVNNNKLEQTDPEPGRCVRPGY
jgi:hypothetical protein